MIVIGCDHAALSMKKALAAHLERRGLEFIDVGTFTEDSVHYPDFAAAAAKEIVEGNAELGFLICGTGVGMSIAANKIRSIRAACCSDTFSVKMTRAHNDANILCFGARVVGEGLAMELVDTFLDTPFEGGRHSVRIDMITALEENVEL